MTVRPRQTSPETPPAVVEIDGTLPRALALPRASLRAAAAYFASRSAARARVPFRAVTVILQDDAASDAAHRAILSVSGATDVITQRYDPMPGEAPGVYGELYVNCDRALAAASPRGGWSPAKELLLYVAHGMDHLTGEDDTTPAGFARMRRRELSWLRACPAAEEL
jgi:rRNA maturation RNase YbeY